jgi:hypothetical protein
MLYAIQQKLTPYIFYVILYHQKLWNVQQFFFLEYSHPFLQVILY